MLGLLLGLGVGMMMPVQTCINSRLKLAVGSPFVSSLISFATGTFFLAVLALVLEGTILFSPEILDGAPAWIWLGGLFGMVGVTTNIFVFPKLGGVQTVVLPVSGQILMSLVIDHFALFGSQHLPLSWLRFLGALLVLCGVLGAVSSGRKPLLVRNHRATVQGSSGNLWGWRALALGSGFLMAAQTAINGRLGIVLDSSIKAALCSFSIGTLALLLVLLALRIKVRLVVPAGKTGNPGWMWLGGFLGGIYVFAMAYLAPAIGTGLTVMCSLTGMISASLLVDRFGLLEAQKKPVSLLQVLSLLVMLGGIALIRLT